MPATLSDEQARLAAEAIDWYVREGIPERHIRQIALGEVQDEKFEKLKELRLTLQDLIMERRVIGRVAFDYLNGIRWSDEPAIERILTTAKQTPTRVTMRAPREMLTLFADILQERAEMIMASDELNGTGRLEARRLAGAASVLAAEPANGG